MSRRIDWLVFTGAFLLLSATAGAQEIPLATQRAFLIANFAQQVGQLEMQLLAAQKSAEDWEKTFKIWCGTAPNCGRLGEAEPKSGG